MIPMRQTFSNPAEEIAYLRAHIAETNEVTVRLTETFETKIRLMQHQIEDLVKRLYGRSSEKINPDQFIMSDVLLEADKAARKTEEVPAETILVSKVKEHTRHKHGRKALPAALERVEHVLDVDVTGQSCHCGKALKCIGEDSSEKLDSKPATLFINVYRRPKYACPDCNCSGCGVKQAPVAANPIERCVADNGLLAHVITEKFEHHTPLYRQEAKFVRQGVGISRQVMADWLEGCAKAIKPLYDLMRERILEYDLVLNDDTPVDMRDGPEPGVTTARFWATVGGENFKYTMYNFTLGRGADGPEEFFKNYEGYFVSDAYAGYNGLFKPKKGAAPKIINAGCWTHARRYFVKAQDTAPRAATEMLSLIAKLYKIEESIKHSPPEHKRAIRQKESLPIVHNKIRLWLEANLREHLPQSPMRKGIEYTLGIWPQLNVYLQDGRIPIDNNLAENAIRPIALGRKNWLFVGSETGGHTAAVLMTFTATCHKNKINTWEYLKDILPRVQSHPAKRLYELLPDHWQSVRLPASK
jgi:transposase